MMLDSFAGGIVAGMFGCFGSLIHSLAELMIAQIGKMKIHYGKWLLTFFLNLIIGLMAGLILSVNPVISFLAGFCGGTVITGIYENFSKEKVTIKK